VSAAGLCRAAPAIAGRPVPTSTPGLVRLPNTTADRFVGTTRTEDPMPDPVLTGPTLSYNIPQEIAYRGDSHIEIVLRPEDWLVPTVSSASAARSVAQVVPLASALMLMKPSLRPVDGDGGPLERPDPPTKANKPVVVEVTIDTPSDGGELRGNSGGVTLYVRGSARVTSGVDTIGHVDVQIGSAPPVRANPLAADWSSWDAATNVTVSGPLAVTATAYNSTSAISKSRQIRVPITITPDPPTPDTVPPVLTVELPKPSSTVYVDGDGASTVPLAGTVVDPPAGSSGLSSFIVLVDGRSVDVVPAADGRFAADLPLSGRGVHTVTLTAMDAAGHSVGAALDVSAVDVPPTSPVVQRLLVVERYRLSTYACGYAVGDPLKTITLAPGETTSYSVKSYEKTTATADTTSSILDSSNEVAKADFEDTLSAEQTNKTANDESLKWHVDAKASASWGIASASIDGGVAGASSAAREELAKNVSSSVAKHASERSSQRQLDIHTSRETKTETDVENAVESKISNINLSCTLNVVFSQLVMQYVTLLHLVDVRIGYVRADDVVGPDAVKERRFTYREVTLSQLDALLEQVVRPERAQDAKEALLEVLTNVFDYQDEQHVLVEERTLLGRDGTAVPNGSYLRVPKGLSSTYVDEGGMQLVVPGVILAVVKSTMKTASAVADCVKGAGMALDSYNAGLQAAALQAKQLDNARAELAQALVSGEKADGAKIYEEVFLPAPVSAAPPLVSSNGTSPA